MRVWFLNRDPRSHPGGDLIACSELAKALGKMGVEVSEGWKAFNTEQPPDIAHLFHCNFDWAWKNFEMVRQLAIPYVMTPVFYPATLHGVTPIQVGTMLSRAQCLFPFSYLEADAIAQEYPQIAKAVHVVPNGTSGAFHGPDGGGKPNWVLAVSARGFDDKNVRMIQEAARLADMGFRGAYQEPHANLPALYRSHGFFVNASDGERMSLTIGEALCAGCRVIATTENWGNGWYGPQLQQFDPRSGAEVLARMLTKARTLPFWDFSPNRLARELTWDYVAKQTKQIYEEVLSGRGNRVSGVA